MSSLSLSRCCVVARRRRRLSHHRMSPVYADHEHVESIIDLHNLDLIFSLALQPTQRVLCTSRICSPFGSRRHRRPSTPAAISRQSDPRAAPSRGRTPRRRMPPILRISLPVRSCAVVGPRASSHAAPSVKLRRRRAPKRPSCSRQFVGCGVAHRMCTLVFEALACRPTNGAVALISRLP